MGTELNYEGIVFKLDTRETVSSEVTVVIDDYGTGEVVYEGPLYGDFSLMASVLLGESGLEPSIEWDLHKGKPVAFVTVDFGDGLEILKRRVATEESYRAFTSEPVYEGLTREERDELSELRRPERERLFSEHFDSLREWKRWLSEE